MRLALFIRQNLETILQEWEDFAAQSHATNRVNAGFSIEELMAEYRAMRASVLRLWQARVKHADESDLQDGMARRNCRA